MIDQDQYPVHVLRYEDLKNNTLQELLKTLDFLRVSYDPETVASRLKEDYSEFYRHHGEDDFKHYSDEQKLLLESTLQDMMEAAERTGKSSLLRLNEYFYTISNL